MNDASPESVSWPVILGDLVAGNDMAPERAHHAVAAMLAGEASDAQVAGFLVALAAKGERTDELLAMRRAMYDVASLLALPPGTIDIVGVGGAPRRRTAAFNVSTISSIVAAAAGATVCKHGNRRASSTSGSFDLLEALGVAIDVDPSVVEAGVHEIGLGFAFARAHHPSMRHVGPARAALGIPTVFNVLGPLAHPGQVRSQVIGVPDASRAAQIAAVIADTDAQHVWVVHGHGDLDELATSGPSQVTEVKAGTVRSFTIEPHDLGLEVVPVDAIEGGDAATNARLARSVLAADPGPNRDIVVLNAAAGLVVAGIVADLEAGVAAAALAIDDGRAASKLDQLVGHTNA